MAETAATHRSPDPEVVADHRALRLWWAWSAVVAFALGVAVRLLHLPGAVYLITPTLWIWCMVMWAYHHGWLRRDRLGLPLMPTGPITIKRGREYENGPIHHANDGCTDHV